VICGARPAAPPPTGRPEPQNPPLGRSSSFLPGTSTLRSGCSMEFPLFRSSLYPPKVREMGFSEILVTTPRPSWGPLQRRNTIKTRARSNGLRLLRAINAPQAHGHALYFFTRRAPKLPGGGKRSVVGLLISGELGGRRGFFVPGGNDRQKYSDQRSPSG